MSLGKYETAIIEADDLHGKVKIRFIAPDNVGYINRIASVRSARSSDDVIKILNGDGWFVTSYNVQKEYWKTVIMTRQV